MLEEGYIGVVVCGRDKNDRVGASGDRHSIGVVAANGPPGPRNLAAWNNFKFNMITLSLK